MLASAGAARGLLEVVLLVGSAVAVGVGNLAAQQLPDEAVLALVEHFVDDDYERPLFFLEDRMASVPVADSVRVMPDMEPWEFQHVVPTPELVDRLRQMAVTACRVEAEVRCPPAYEACAATIIAVGDVVSRDGDLVRTRAWLFELLRGGQAARHIFGVRLRVDDGERWSVLDFPSRFVSDYSGAPERCPPANPP